MILLIRRAIMAAGRPPSVYTVRLGLGSGTTVEEAEAVLAEAIGLEVDA